MAKEELMGVHVSGVPHYSPKGMRIWIVLCVSWTTLLAFCAVALRLWSRRIRKQSLWWDDYMLLFSMVWNWAVLGIGFAMFFEGVGYHAWQLHPQKKRIENISMWLLVTEIIYIWNLCWTKISLLLMYYRIFNTPFFKKMAIVVGTFVVAWAITITFLFTFICVPVQKLWRPEIPGHCVSELGVWLANASSTIFSDIMILLLPIPQVWRLNLRRPEKIGLTLVFGLGFFAVFASSFRTWVLFNYSKNDISYTLAPLLVWSDVEMCAGIISACLPTLRPVIAKAARKVGLEHYIPFSRHTHDSSNPGQSGGIRSNRSKEEGNISSSNRNTSDAFYRLPDHSDHSDLEGILVETGHFDGSDKLRTESKTSRYATSSVDMDGHSLATTEQDIAMERLR